MLRVVPDRGSVRVLAIVLALGGGCDDATLPLPEHELRFHAESFVIASGRRVVGGPTLVMQSDGTLVLGSEVQGRVQSDGTMLDPSGTPKGSIDPRGHLVLEGQDAHATIDPDGTLHVDGTDHVLRISSAGDVSGTDPEAPRFRVEGLSSETRRTAMSVIVLGWLGAPGRVSVGRAPTP